MDSLNFWAARCPPTSKTTFSCRLAHCPSNFTALAGLVAALDSTCGQPTHSVYVVKLPFACNRDLFDDGPAFPSLCFLDFLSDLGNQVLTYLHVQLRSYRNVLPPTATASYSGATRSTVPMSMMQHSNYPGGAPSSVPPHGNLCACCGRNSDDLCYCPTTRAFFCNQGCRSRWLDRVPASNAPETRWNFWNFDR